MTFYVKKDPNRDPSIPWSKAKGFFVKVDPDRSSSIPWRTITAAFVKISPTQWKKFWGVQYSISSPVNISLSVDPTTQYFYLTGTNYKWTPNTPNPPDQNALTYKFTWYNGTTTSTLVAPTKIPNGTLSGTTYSPTEVNPIPQSKFLANATNTYTFYVEAPDNTISLKAISIQGPTNISVSISSISTSSATISWNISAGAISYVVEYRQTGSTTWTSAGNTTNNSITIPGLTNIMSGTSYDFRVTPYTGLSGKGYAGNSATASTSGLYYVTFNGNGGLADGVNSNITRIQTSPGGSVLVPTPTKTSARFNGWYTLATGGTQIIAPGVTTYTPTSNTTLYAQWTQQYTVSYSGNGGSGTVTDTSSPYDAGSTVTVKENGYTYTRKTFVSWNTKADGTGTTYYPPSFAPNLTPNSFVINADTTLFAQWVSVPSGTLTYNANGGSGSVPVDNNTYFQGDTVTVLFSPAPTISGTTFRGWSKTASSSFPQYTSTGTNTFLWGTETSIVLYAIYDTYVSNFNFTDTTQNLTANSITVGNSTTTNIGSVSWTNSTGLIATKDSAYLSSISGANNGTFSDTLSINSSATFNITAAGSTTATVTTKNSGRATVSWNQGSMVKFRINYSIQGTTGSTGWIANSSSSPSYDFYSNGTAITVTSMDFESASGIIYTNAFGGRGTPATLTVSNRINTATGTGTVTYIDPKPVNTIAPHLTNSGTTITSTSGTWTNSPTSYTYRWYRSDIAEGSAGNPIRTNTTTSTTDSYTGSTSNNYDIYTKVTATNASGSNVATSDNSINLYQSTTPPPTYIVTWSTINGGTVNPTSSSVTAGQSVIAPTPTYSGYTFNGWYTAQSGGTLAVAAGGSYTPTGNVTLYAQWTAVVTTYTIYWTNFAYTTGGSSIGAVTVNPSSSSGVSGATVTAPTPSSIPGYTFARWYDAQNQRDATYSVLAGGTWTIGTGGTGNMTFYPLYTVNATTTAATTTAATTTTAAATTTTAATTTAATTTTTTTTAATTTAATTTAATTTATRKTCTSLDVANQFCKTTGCDSGGCATGSPCSTNVINRCF